ncbi:MAG: deoxyribose-phosphate aldolase [Armatimonadetes bacterium]|nr:deoxyribose-phosphate aldolase [Armatimonadota bacterium]
MYTREQFAKMMDYTLLRATSTRDDVIRICSEARDYHFASVCVLPCWVNTAARQLEGSDVKVGTVVSFPYGATSRAVKVAEAKAALAKGAEELDVVMNISAFKSGEYEIVEREVNDLVDVLRMNEMISDDKRAQIKFIIETCFLTDPEKKLACEIIRDAGADFIKTSTGTAQRGATVDDIRFIRRIVGPGMGVKAAGGIRTVQQTLELLDAGANRIGTSAAVYLYQNYNPEQIARESHAAVDKAS